MVFPLIVFFCVLLWMFIVGLHYSRYSERVQEEWFEIDRNWVSHSGVCVCLRLTKKTRVHPHALFSLVACRFQRSPRKHANANMLRRSMSASRHCRRSCLVSSPPPDGTSLAWRRRPSSAWGSRTGSRRASRIRPIWRRGPSSACPFKRYTVSREGRLP